MDHQDLVRELARETDSRIVFLIMDGLGGLPLAPGGQTELETAKTPNLDRLAAQSVCGLLDPIAPGITPGSGPGHLALFGFDPVRWNMGRGVLEACGINFPLQHGDIAIRINFCTVDEKGTVTDRRAGRISTDQCQELSALLDRIKVPGVELMVRPVKEHRAVVVFRGQGLEGPLTDADPHREGAPIPAVEPVNKKSAKAKKVAKLVADFYKLALPVIAKEKPANGFLMRGIAHQPAIPLFQDRYMLKPACIAVYPMYKGLAQLVGMAKLEGPQNIKEQFERYLAEYSNYDFFFIHFKYPDKYGEDGNFAAKKKAIEDFDAALPVLLQKMPDVLAITGDHSTPCPMKGHSWHPQPVLLTSACSGSDKLERFTETGSNLGSLGIFEANYLIRYMQANAKMLDKFGA